MSSPRQIVERHIAAFAAKDAAAEPFGADFEMVTPAGQFRGREEALGFLRVYWNAFPDARLEVNRWCEGGESTAAEGTMMGTHTGTLMTPNGEVPATGRAVRIRWAAMYQVRGEELVSEHLYFDQMEFMSQLGLVPEPSRAG